MNFKDILKLSADSLRGRKWRTILTMLGVSIGTISVVIMLSLGFGLKSSLETELNSYGAANDITVTYVGNEENLYITDSKLEEFENLSYVKHINPELIISGQFKIGKYETSISIWGLTEEEMANIPLGEGRLPESSEGELEFVVGNQVICELYDSNTGVYPYYDENKLADVDFMKDEVVTRLFNEHSTENTYDSYFSKQLHLPIVGMVEGDTNTYGKFAYGVYANIDDLKAYLNKHYKGQLIPGQPTNKNGRPYKEWVYQMITINIDNSDNVDAAVEYFRELGYQVSSNAEWLEENNKIINIAQMVLGGIGAVALLVAAIGITNTITMSIYERRKEIGVMKVLGCDIKNIGALFVTEAGFIGFLGGVYGIMLSYLLSALVNLIAGDLLSHALELSGKLSIIPFWLPFIAIVFATLVGILAGYFPSKKATKISVLEAIRNG